MKWSVGGDQAGAGRSLIGHRLINRSSRSARYLPRRKVSDLIQTSTLQHQRQLAAAMAVLWNGDPGFYRQQAHFLAALDIARKHAGRCRAPVGARRCYRNRRPAAAAHAAALDRMRSYRLPARLGLLCQINACPDVIQTADRLLLLRFRHQQCAAHACRSSRLRQLGQEFEMSGDNKRKPSVTAAV